MTKKKNQKEEVKADAPKNAAPKKDKLILFEAVQENPTPNYIIIGALTTAGLIEQYEQEELDYGIEDIEPSITADELNKIIKKFIGE